LTRSISPDETSTVITVTESPARSPNARIVSRSARIAWARTAGAASSRSKPIRIGE